MWLHRKALLKSPVPSPGKGCITKEDPETVIQSPSQSVNQRRKALDQLRLSSIPQEAGRFGSGRLSWAKRSRGIKGPGNWTSAPTLDASWPLLKRVILRLTGKDSVRRWDRELRWERSLVFKRSYLDIFNDFKSPGLEHWKLLQCICQTAYCVTMGWSRNT